MSNTRSRLDVLAGKTVFAETVDRTTGEGHTSRRATPLGTFPVIFSCHRPENPVSLDIFMKRIFVFSLLCCSLFVACRSNEEVVRGQRVGHQGHRYGYNDTLVEPEPTPVPVPAVAPVSVTPEVRPTPPPPPAAPTPAPTPRKRDIPYAKLVPGKPGYATSPYNPDGGLIDVHDWPPGTPIKDPYAPGKIILVP